MRAIFPDEDLPPGTRIFVHPMNGCLETETMVLFNVPAKAGDCAFRTYVCDGYNPIDAHGDFIQKAAYALGFPPDGDYDSFDDLIFALDPGEQAPVCTRKEEDLLKMWTDAGNLTPTFNLEMN